MWVGFDFDGTLCTYTGWKGPDKLGEPIPNMVSLVKEYLGAGITCKIVTARAAHPEDDDYPRAIQAIKDWCKKHIGRALPVQARKGWGMVLLYDDRAVSVKKNTGQYHDANALERELLGGLRVGDVLGLEAVSTTP